MASFPFCPRDLRGGIGVCLPELDNLVLKAEILPGIGKFGHSIDCVLLVPEPVVKACFFESLGAGAVLIHALDVNLISSLHFNFPFRPGGLRFVFCFVLVTLC